MIREFRVFTFYGLPVSIVPGFFAGTGLTIVTLWAIGAFVLGLGAFPAFAGAIAATALMWVSELIHQLGHAVAARRAGHPMIAITLGRYLVLGASVYPTDEGALPPAVHIQRALGGPIASLIASAVVLPLAFALQPAGGAPFAVTAFLFLLNFAAFTLQVALPLRFNDGAVLWQYLRR